MAEVEPTAVVGVPGATPVPVIVAGVAPTAGAPGVQQQATDPSVAAKTTFQEDLVTAGQRHINLVWERTQQIIAVGVSFVVSLVCAHIIVWGDESLRAAAFLFLTNIMTAITTTYFIRTNHTKTGGVGPNEAGR